MKRPNGSRISIGCIGCPSQFGAAFHVVCPPLECDFASLDRLQILNQLTLLFGSELEFQVSLVVVDDGLERGEPAVMIEATLVNLLRVEQRAQRRRDVAPVRAAVRLETVD